MGRNIWAVLTKFNKLPNDPLIQSLTTDQWNFILFSMKQDNDDQREAMIKAGVKLPPEESDYADDSFDEVEETGNLVRDGDNPEDIAKQVASMTDSSYSDSLKERLDGDDEEFKDPSIKQVEENLRKLQKSLNEDTSNKPELSVEDKMKQFDDDDEFPEI